MESCSLDLRLSPMTSTLQSCRHDSTVGDHSSVIVISKEMNAVYSKRLSEYDLVELRIRAVIEMAGKERGVTALEEAPVRMGTPLGCSVKKSVKSFLEKRKKRTKSLIPNTSSSSSSPHNF